MSQVDLSSYKILFVKSARERLDKIASELAVADQPHNEETVNNIYISIHALASQNQAMNYTSTGTLCRLIENFFYKVKHGQTQLDAQKIQFVNDALVKVRQSIDNIEATNHELDLAVEQTDIKQKLNL